MGSSLSGRLVLHLLVVRSGRIVTRCEAGLTDGGCGMLGRMRFTEHELTVAVTSAAKVVAGGRSLRRDRGEAAWEAMSRIDRYHLLEAVGAQVLPVLLALSANSPLERRSSAPSNSRVSWPAPSRRMDP